MRYKMVLFAILIVLVVIFQTAFLGSFGKYGQSFNLILSLGVFLIFGVGFGRAFFWLAGAGLIMDIYSSLPFGVFSFSLLLTIIILQILFYNFFTNRSLYSILALGSGAVALFQFFFLVISGIFYLLGISDFYIDRRYWLSIAYQLANTLLILLLLFFLTNSLSKKFKSNFID